MQQSDAESKLSSRGLEKQDAGPTETGKQPTRPTRGLVQRLRQHSNPQSASAPRVTPESTQAATEAEATESTDRLITEAPQTKRVTGRGPAGGRGGLLPVGAQLQDRYKILGVVGIGGMGAVYKAQDLRFPGVTRLCAVKEMINTATDPTVREMIVRNFEREAGILATLSHPAIPRVYDYFTEGRRSYLVLEFIDGKDLEEHLAEIEGFIPEATIIDWAVQICDVLTYLHNHQPKPIIFRDLKPSNIMLDRHGRIRLVDFGIAKLFQSGEKGTMIGTEGYSPPEQYRGIAEPRGDIYALGATLHHLLSKQDPRLEPPFSFDERPIHKGNPTVSRELIEIVERALSYDIEERWSSAAEMKKALLSLPLARGLAVREITGFHKSVAIKPIWRFACEDEVRGSVMVEDGTVFVPCYDHNLYALDAANGAFRWKYAARGGVASSPAVSEGVLAFGSTDHVIYGLDVDNGRLMWTLATQGKVYSSACAQFGHFFIGSDDGQLYAIHARSGRRAWRYAADGEIRSRPLVAGDTILFTCSMGIVYALKLDRQLRWRFRARRGILASPIIHENLVFVGSLDWNMYALDARSGWSLWHFRVGGPIASTAVVWNGIVIFGSADHRLYALQADDGKPVWRQEAKGQITGSPFVYNDAVYVGSVDGALYCVDAASGEIRWRYETDGPITGRPHVVDGVVYFGSADHYVYALPA